MEMRSGSLGDTEVMAVEGGVERKKDSSDDCEGVPNHYHKKRERDKDSRDKWVNGESQEGSKVRGQVEVDEM